MKTCLLLTLPLILLSGCAGRVGKPVPLYIPGDENLTCEQLQTQMLQLQAQMDILLPKADKDSSNILYALTLPTAFFMDLKQGEKIEYDSMLRRHNRLFQFWEKKECTWDYTQTGSTLPDDETSPAQTASFTNE